MEFIPHDHLEFDAECFRCHLGRDEAREWADLFPDDFAEEVLPDTSPKETV